MAATLPNDPMAPGAGRSMRAFSGRAASSRSGIALVAGLVLVMWVSEILDTIVGGRLDAYGISPRDPDGLVGLVTSPFLHAGFGHLAGNTLPFLLMGFLIALSGLARVALVTVVIAVVGGFGTWLLAPPSTLHIGASGIVFGYAAYLLSRGFFNRRPLPLAVAALVALVWGGALLGGLLPQEGISWQGHLFGALGGVLAANLLARPRGRAPAPG